MYGAQVPQDLGISSPDQPRRLFEVERGHLRAVEWNVPLLPGDDRPRDDASSA